MACLDSDILVSVMRGNPDARDFFEKLRRDEDLSTTIVTVCELYEGAFKSDDPKTGVQRIHALIKSLKVLGLNMGAALLFGQLTAALQKSGDSIEDFEALIACIAMSHGETLVTRNIRHFNRVSGLDIQTW